jgi:hypothetical protein
MARLCLWRIELYEQMKDNYPDTEPVLFKEPKNTKEFVYSRNEELHTENLKFRKLNAELLAALRQLRDDDSMPGRFLPLICEAIAKVEKLK